jgi:alpha-D-xyloside xylohydrolase
MGRLVAALAALALVAAGCGAPKAQHGISIEVDKSPFRIAVLRDGKSVVSEYDKGGLRYQLASSGNQYSLTDVTSSSGGVYQVATNEPGRTATVRVSRTATGARIDVALHPAANVQEVFDAFGTGPDEHFLGGGERGETVDLRGQILSMKVDYRCSYVPIPFFASSAGWGVRLVGQNVSALAFPGSTGGAGCQGSDDPACTFPPLSDHAEVCVQGSRLEEDVYLGPVGKTLADYEADAGLPSVPPPSELELIKWRDVSAGPADLLDDIHRLQAAGIPIGWELLDNPWEACNGLLTFDRNRFPDPAGLIKAVHARRVEFMLWVSPRETCPQGYPAGSLLGPAGHQVLDFRKPAALGEFQARLRRLVALGVDGVKGDRADELDLQAVDPALTNEYPLLFARAVMGALPKDAGAIFRAATSGSQQVVPGLWAGDQPQVYVGLQRAIVAAATAAMSGFPTWGSDVGGYAAPPEVTEELFVRWSQLGAVSPVMEVGGIGVDGTPWQLGPQAMDGLRASAVLHYELFPYLYGLLQRHEPVLRPLAYGFPGDPQSWTSPFEILVGSDLLAAPVTGPGTTPSVYLPPGRWVDLYAGTTVQGGGPSFTRPTGLLQFPLYARAGAVLPFNLRTDSGSWWDVNELTHPGRAGWLATNGARLDLTGQPGDVQLFVPFPSRPGSVTIGGHAVPFTWSSGPLPGAVVRLHGPAIRGMLVVSPA